jgi:hypothetical protein
MNPIKISQRDKEKLRGFLGQDSCIDPTEEYIPNTNKFPTRSRAPVRSQTFILDDLKRKKPAIDPWKRTTNMPNIPEK